MRLALQGICVALVLTSACGRSGVFERPFVCSGDPAAPTSAGCAFVVAASVNFTFESAAENDVDPDDIDPDGVFVVNPSDDQTVAIRVEAVPPGNARGDTIDEFHLRPGEHRLVKLPRPEPRDATGLRSGDIVHLAGDGSFEATQFGPYRSFLGNDSSLLLPESSCGRRYVVAAYPPHATHFQGWGEPSFFEIVALHDDTRLRWHASRSGTASGQGLAAVSAGAWSPEIVLDRFEAIFVTADTRPSTSLDAGDVSGTWIEASAPVRVASGTRCAAVPSTADPLSGCDPLFEQLVPVELWGERYVVAHPPPRTREMHHARIYAGAPGVSVRAQPPVLPADPHVFTAAGDFIDVVADANTSFALLADGPILPVVYLQSRDPDTAIADPAMVQVVPIEQYRSHYRVVTGTEWDTHFIQVVRERSGAQVLVGDEPVVDWEPVDSWETAIVEISEGAHTVTSAQPFGLTQYGWTNSLHDACLDHAPFGTCQTSYAHAGGMRTATLQPR